MQDFRDRAINNNLHLDQQLTDFSRFHFVRIKLLYTNEKEVTMRKGLILFFLLFTNLIVYNQKRFYFQIIYLLLHI